VFHKVLVANRGAVARRILAALAKLGIRSAVVYSEADEDAPYLSEADETVLVGEAPAHASYLNQDAIITALRATGADALHPGYGFLAENAAFAARVESNDVRFIGPSPRWLEAMGHKTRARDLMAAQGLPVGPGSGVVDGNEEAVLAAAERVGYPVMVKPAAGGGGIGMLQAATPEELLKAVERARSMAQRGFRNDEVYLEKLLDRPRHIEIQIVADRHGAVRHLFERDCSVQRRHQKIIEEAPAPALERGPLAELATQYADALAGLGYDNIGTVEMLLGQERVFSFLEMNTRLQVEHGVTEAITGVDLVEAQIRAAAGEALGDFLPESPAVTGHAIEARVYAEDPVRFLPSPGRLTTFRPPAAPGLRVDTGYAEGGEVTPHYDPLLAKVIAHGQDREAAMELLAAGLRDFAVEGVKVNIPALLQIVASAPFRAGEVHTGLIAEVMAAASA
jgi:acetyl-CoA carboxylase biotin carboxylase subunit